MSLDQHLPDALRRAAGDHEPPAPDLPAIVDGGRRRKRRRDVRRVAVAAACLAVVSAIPFVARTLVTDSTPPPTGEVDRVARVTDLPTGAAPRIPYCAGDRMILGAGEPVAAACDVLIHRGGTTLYLDRHGVNRLADGEVTLLDSRYWSSWWPALSLDGRWAAWVTETPRGVNDALLLGFDVRSGEQVAEVPWPTAEGWVAGIDDLGRVYFQDYADGAVLMHDLRTGDTTPVTGLPDHGSPSINFVTADGFAIRSTQGTYVVGSVNAAGAFTQQRAGEQYAGTSFSPDRSHAVFEHDRQLVASAVDGDGAPVPLQLPEHGEPVWFPVWESTDSVLVQFDPVATPRNYIHEYGLSSPARRTWLLRCHVRDGSCEVALPAGWGDRMAGPVYR